MKIYILGTEKPIQWNKTRASKTQSRVSLQSCTAVSYPPGKHKPPKRLQPPACTESNGIPGTRVTACMKKQLTCLGKTGGSGKNHGHSCYVFLKIRCSCQLVRQPCAFSFQWKFASCSMCWLSGGKGMLKMTCGGLGKCCDIPGRYLNAKKPPLWANASGACLLWRKCFKLNLRRSRTKAEMCHNGCPHPERANELFHLMNEPVFDVLGTMPTSCSSVTHVLTPPKGVLCCCQAQGQSCQPAATTGHRGCSGRGRAPRPSFLHCPCSWVLFKCVRKFSFL